MENFWSLFKRGLMGSFHKVSVKHLPRYLAEFTYRFNNRQAQNLFAQTLSRLVGTITMPYRTLVANDYGRPALLFWRVSSWTWGVSGEGLARPESALIVARRTFLLKLAVSFA
jgi:ISXO2-like transposase domain